MTTLSMQSLNKARAIMESNEYLDPDRSRECFKFIFESTVSSVELEESASLVGQFLLQCDRSFLCHIAVRSLEFWNLLKEVLEEVTAQELNTYLNTILLELLRQPQTYKKSLNSLCQATSSDSVILELLVLHLSVEGPKTETTTETLKCLLSFFACHSNLLKFYPAEAAHIIPSFLLQSHESGLFDALTAILCTNDGRIEIVKELVARQRDMLTFLKTVPIDEYESPWKKRLIMSLSNAINPGGKQNFKFEESTDFKRMNEVNLLQAFSTTAFLNSKNLTFLKTFTEQQLFGARPFPLFDACLRICDITNGVIEKLETDITNAYYNITFSLNRDKLMYALMDRLLKSWVESQAETKEDLDSLLTLVPIIFERMKKSIPESSNLSPSEYLRLALDVIQEVNYKLSRQLQLDALRETGYERWSKEVSYFDEVLANQVHEYLHHQRLLQLQKGTWVYSENPLDPKIKSPKVYYIVLSANQAKLLVKEYSRITEKTPFTEENEILSPESELGDEKSKTRVIAINSISSFTSERILFDDKTPTDSHLVNVIQKNVYTRVEFLDESGKSILVIFFDTNEAIYTWLDGLQLVCCIKHRGGLSSGTTDQIETLIDLRKCVQMINLAEIGVEPRDCDSDDDQYYDIEKLKEVTSSFYYE